MTHLPVAAETPLDVRYDGDAVVVTGVGRSGQLGEVVARAFASRGAHVCCIDRGESANDRAAELVKLGLRATGYQVDLTDFGATSKIADSIAALHAGRVVAVAALAGGFAPSGPVGESSQGVYEKQIAINLTTAFNTARAFVPLVRTARGAFVFVTSAAVLAGGRVAGLSAYAAAKAGVIQLVRALSQEERSFGVRANALAPTSIRTAANIAAMGADMKYVEREEVAAAVLALCGPGFVRVTGQVIELA